MATLAQQPFGKGLLTSVAVGLLALVLWQTSEIISGTRHGPPVQRVRKKTTNGARALIYAALGMSAISVVFGSHESSSTSEQHAATGVLSWPGGAVLVVVAGLVTAGVGVALVVKGVKGRHQRGDRSPVRACRHPTGCYPSGPSRLRDERRSSRGRRRLLGYLAVGSDRREVGLDGALKTILQQPFGRFLLTAVAVGFVAFGRYWMLQSRFRRL
jgi:hypothetical protein